MKNLLYNFAKRIVFETGHEEVQIKLNELKTWLIINKYQNHIILSTIYSVKLQGSTTKPKDDFNNIPFVKTFHDTDNGIMMKHITLKIKNTPSVG